MLPLTRSGLVLGLGMGGFVDGIVLHQILGWHHLICTTATCQVQTVDALKLQNTQDGFFHLATWIITAIGISMLFRAARDNLQPCAGQSLFGAILAGWGVFNVVEGVIDHQLLGIHHVVPGHPRQLMFDLLFLAAGLALIGAGTVLVRRSKRRSTNLAASG